MKTSQPSTLSRRTVPPAVLPSPSLEERVAHLESLLGPGIGPRQQFDVEAFLISPEGIAEFKAACRRLAIYNDRGPLEAFCEKTGGKTPRGWSR